ncbi:MULTISPECIES: hypothetical protein [Brevibacillus]|jgi:hypothetical protein|uniref:Uncharacterized protein n=1 Tax=Brevibacillus thermoruber TaxID=33942 RepID=A0A9X3TLY4_9BACL|nr:MULTISPECIES: hypothetical protein [Brevibacillus]MDA5106871.1 hypothetical protein [Brevibacillus thermoruber]TRY28135.1 hypothetical protein FOI68_01910 [Brevibacillus sp. LEMMJ03]
MPRRLLAAIAVSTLLALMLSLVPGVPWNQPDIPAFQASRPVDLSEQNVVDLFTFMSTHYNIKRVKWENPSVHVDLAVSSGQRAELPLVYRDFYVLVRDLFRLTANVEQVYIRLLEVEPDTPAPKLLIAVEAQRKDKSAYETPPEQIADLESHIRARFPVRIDPYFYQRVSP